MDRSDIVQFNCNGLRGNYHQIVQLLRSYNPKFVLLQELKLGYGDKVVFKGYKLITNLKPGDDHYSTSVGILIKNGIIYTRIAGLEDLCLVGINTIDIVPVSIYSYYDSVVLRKLSKRNLVRIVNAGDHKPIIMGDFNSRDKLWDRSISSLAHPDARAKIIIDFIDDSNLVLMNHRSTTRISPILGNNNTAIDLSLIDADLVRYFKWCVIEESFGSDHLPTCLSVETANINIHKFRIYDYKSTDWDLFNEHCDLSNIDIVLHSIDDIDKLIEEKIIYGLENSTHFFDFPNNKKRAPPWWDNEINNLKKQKNKFLGIYIKSKSKDSLINMKKFNCLYKRKLKEKKNESWEKFISECNGDIESKELWSRIKKINGQNCDKYIRCLSSESNEVTDEPQTVCDMLADHYSNISNSNKLSDGERRSLSKLNEKLENFGVHSSNFEDMNQMFTIEELKTTIRNTSNSAPGMDGIKYNVFKNMNDVNLEVILNFFNKVWSLSTRPVEWRKSVVIPIPKCPDAKYPNDTRPINLIKSRPKLLDKLINARLIHILESNNLISSNQFGFRKCKQTLDSLIKLDNVIEKEINGNHVHLVSFDIMKAFDKIWPQSILLKLKEFSIGGNMYDYIVDYLQERSFKVRNGAILSKSVQTDIGVPQGSPLSSTLFIIAFQHILEEIEEDAETSYLAYADDLVIYVTNSSNMLNTKNLQSIINRISKKGLTVGLKFSVEKSKSLHICKKTSCSQISNKIYGKLIPKVSSVKLLGLVIQKKHQYKLHLNILLEKLAKDLRLLKVLSNRRYGMNQDIMRRIILALSVSKIRYCIEIYGRICDTDVSRIDVVLNKMRRLMLGSFITTPIPTLLIQSGIPNFQDIRLKCNLLFSVKKSPFDYVSQRSARSHSEEVNRVMPNFEFGLEQIIKDSALVPPSLSIKNQIFKNIFNKKKSEIVPGYLLPEIHQFCDENVIDNCLFTDGSKINNKVGYAVVGNGEVLKSARINNNASVYTAEAMAVLSAVLYIKEVFPASKSVIFTDNAGILDELSVCSRKKNEIINQIKLNLDSSTLMAWVPSHYGVPGNEYADAEAKRAANFEEIDEINITSTDARRTYKAFITKKIQNDWNLNILNKLFLIRQSSSYVLSKSTYGKKTELILNRLRAGHSFATHSHLLSKEQPPVCNKCPALLTVEHIFTCNSNSRRLLRRRFDIDNWKVQLFKEDMVENIIEFIKESGYFQLI